MLSVRRKRYGLMCDSFCHSVDMAGVSERLIVFAMAPGCVQYLAWVIVDPDFKTVV